jgi:hypothetical protein
MNDTETMTAPTSPDAAPKAAQDLSQFKLVGNHVRVPAELAERHPLNGVKGWTLALGVLLILDAVANVIGLFMLLTNAGESGLVALFALAHVGLCLWLVACVVKLYEKNPSFPALFLGYCGVSALYVVLIALLGGGSWVTLVQLAVVVIYAGYVGQSRRVRVTYSRELDPRDPLLAEIFPEGLPAHLKPAPAPLAKLDEIHPRFRRHF